LVGEGVLAWKMRFVRIRDMRGGEQGDGRGGTKNERKDEGGKMGGEEGREETEKMDK
jgi:hypothetical protein